MAQTRIAPYPIAYIVVSDLRVVRKHILGKDHKTTIAIDDSLWYFTFLTPLNSNHTLYYSTRPGSDERMGVRGCHFAEEVQYVGLVAIEGARIMTLQIFVNYVCAAEVGKISPTVTVFVGVGHVEGLFWYVSSAIGR